MPPVTIELPSLLATMVDGVRTVPVEAQTLAAALHELVRLHPPLETHLFDESGDFRQHVLCFHNGTNTRWLEGSKVALSAGDRITILQAVSGG